MFNRAKNSTAYSITYNRNKLIGSLCAGIIGVLLFSVLYFAHAHDASFLFYTTDPQDVHNIGGTLGAHVAALLFYLFGFFAYLVPLGCFFVAYYLLKDRCWSQEWDRVIAFTLLFFIMPALCTAYALDTVAVGTPGGFFGSGTYGLLVRLFDPLGAMVLLHSLVFIATTVVGRFSFIVFATYLIRGAHLVADKQRFLLPVHRTFKKVFTVITYPIAIVARHVRSLFDRSIEEQADADFAHLEKDLFDDPDAHSQPDAFWNNYTQKKDTAVSVVDDAFEVNYAQETTLEKNEIDFSVDVPKPKKEKEKVVQQEPRHEPAQKVAYQLPDLDIFIGVENEKGDTALMNELEKRAAILQEKLERFGVSGAVTSIKRGPVVTLFEYQPDIDSKISKIIALEDDLAMALQALSIRIIAPIPGKSVVGFEVANKNRRDVHLSKVIKSDKFQKFSGGLPIMLGEDTVGNNVVVDLAKMPHLLIAGSTGSGKSMALNTMLMSLLCSRSPEELKLILIDPKRLEFAVYADIAHLLFPIVTNPRKAAPVLKWVVQQMEQRYEQMAQVGARNIFDYNTQAQSSDTLEKLPFIVVIIDELADLMMTASREIEDLITRITQMARAAGIHMIIATQRPSVDVITGLIKVNFPSRISFRVTSKVDSRTILDTSGADKLLGRGDMLFLDSTSAHLQRVHGAYVSDKEIHQVVSHIKAEQKVEYLDIANELKETTSHLLEADDALYKDVVEFLKEIDDVSISLLQRKFRIGYNRSARIIDMLESQGLITPADGGKTRKVMH